MDANAKKILEKILKGESLTKLQNEYKVDKNTITNYYRDIFQNDERALSLFNTVLQRKKEQTSSVELDASHLEDSIWQYIDGKMTLKQAADSLGIHEQTFKKKMLEVVAEREDWIQKYQQRKAQRANYQTVDFQALIVEMLTMKKSQKEIEIEHNLKPKTMSKKIANLQNTEPELYRACKIWANAESRKRLLDEDEVNEINSIVVEYQQSKEEREIE